MKTFKLTSVLAAGLILLSNSASGSESANNLVITNFVLSGNQGTLMWSGGRPTYQVQTLSKFTANWVDVGLPTSNTFAVVPVTKDEAYFRVVSDFTAKFQVLFNATWSQETHPTNWPANAHWSGLVGGTHNDSVHFFRLGETASEGIRLMAERGQQAALLGEIAPAIMNGTAQLQLAGGGTGTSPGSVTMTFPQPMRRDFPLVTLVTMIAPSPDWFVGVDSLNLIENGQWVGEKVVTLYGIDAGTDSGASYSSPDLVTTPREVVAQFTGFPAIQNGVIVPFGTFTFRRLD